MADLAPPYDLYYERGESGARAVVEVELAGIDPDRVDVDVAGQTLELRGAREAPIAATRRYRHAAIARGTFALTVNLGVDVDADRARAGYRDGMLRVELPLVGE